MNKRVRILAMLALGGAACLANQAVLANCVNEGPYEVRQCSKGAWFAAPGPGAGAVSAVWWGIGFGNGSVISSAAETIGNGMLLTPLPGQFIGIDNGSLTPTQLDLVDAAGAGIGAPPGTLCFSAGANWGTPGLDSCIDINRNAASGNGANSASDNIVNPYWDSAPAPNPPGPYDYVYYNHQLDPPMGVLLTESSGKYFAAAFFASIPKTAPKQSNPDPGQFSMGAIVNGDTGPQGPNIIPWQDIPVPTYSAVLSDPNNRLSPRNVTMTWTSPRFINDNSTRPCWSDSPANTVPCASVAGGGVGVLDQGPLIHYEMEATPFDANNNCGTAWATVDGSRVDFPATTTLGNGIAPDSCVRLKTSFGKTPAQAFATSPATTATRDANRLAAQEGKLGDLGYFVASPGRTIGGSLVSEKANLRAVSRDKNNLRVVFDTDTEINITSFDVVGIDSKGGRKVIGTVACKQCTSGLSANYDTLVPDAKLQGSKKIQIVIQPSGAQSNTLSVK